MAAGYDKFMVQVGIGTNRKLRRLPVVQRWAYVAGVLPLAAQSPLRGALLIADGAPATVEDIAEEATIAVKDARAAVTSLRKLGMLETDADGVEWVHDWDEYNRDPKPSDSPEARRERKRRQRSKELGHADVTRDDRAGSRGSHDPEVEEEEEGTTQQEDAGVRAGVQAGALHPDLLEVLAVLNAAPGLVVEEMAVNSACRAHGGHDPVAAANVVAMWAAEGGLWSTSGARLLHSAMQKQAEQSARTQAAGEQAARRPAPASGPRRLTHAEELAQLERAANEQLAREAAERSAA